MKGRFTALILLLSSLASVSLIACTTSPAQEPETMAPSPTPEVSRAFAPEPPALAEFNEQRQSINEAWDLAHDDFDQWRADLTMCHPSAMTEALNGFAVEFNDVTREARKITRTKTTGEFADTLISAAEGEEKALRELRDRWQPGNVSLFESLEDRRNLSAKAQREARDESIALRDTLTKTADPEEVEAFTAAFEALEEKLADAHEEYEELRDEAKKDDAAKVIEQLQSIAETVLSIAEDVEELPDLKGSDAAIKALEKAIEAEVEAMDEAIEDVTAEEEADDEDEEDEEAEGKLPNFKAIDTAVTATDEALEKMADALDAVSVEDTAAALADLTLFDTEYDRLLQTWDRFHSEYNDWRADDGGCDRLEVLESLTEFSSQVDAVGDSVRGLPKSGHLEPVHRLLVEAIEGEEQAFRSLRDTWQPFTLDALRAVDRARIMSDTRRSDADIIIMELESRF